MGFQPKYELRRLKRALTDRRACVYLLNEFYKTRELTTQVIDEVTASLNKRGILARPVNLETIASAPILRKDLVLAHHPLMDEKVLRPCQWLGILPLNRRQRLQLAETVQAPLMPWRYAASTQELLSLFDLWKTDRLLLKKDISLRALGVSVVLRQDCQALKWNAGDVFCPILREDPTTYKVHFLGKNILGCFALHTPAIETRTFNGIDQSPSGVWEASAKSREAVRRIGEALLKFGGGYSSVDMMKYNGECVVVEVNTNSVGFDKMIEHVPSFSNNYTNAVVDVVKRRTQFVCPRTRIVEGIHYFQHKLEHSIKDSKKNRLAA